MTFNFSYGKIFENWCRNEVYIRKRLYRGNLWQFKSLIEFQEK